MIGFWLIFSGKFDLFHLSLGVISCLLVAFFSSDLLFPFWFENVIFWPVGSDLPVISPGCSIRFYWPTCMCCALSFHPRMMDLIDPHIIEFNSHLESDIARTTFANSITLTPGYHNGKRLCTGPIYGSLHRSKLG